MIYTFPRAHALVVLHKLRTGLGVGAEEFPGHSGVMHSLQPDPGCSWAGRVTAFSFDVAAQLRYQWNHFAQARWYPGRCGLVNNGPNRFPLRRLEHGFTTDVRATAPQAAYVKRSPGHDQVQGQARQQPVDVLTLRRSVWLRHVCGPSR